MGPEFRESLEIQCLGSYDEFIEFEELDEFVRLRSIGDTTPAPAEHVEMSVQHG